MVNEARMRAEYKILQGKGYKHIQRGNHQKFKAINDILYSWYKKCKASGIYVTGPILKEKAMNIKSSLNQSVLEDFRACDGWLGQWKLHHGIRKKLISGESLVVSKTTMESWMEIIKELCPGYDCQNIGNMDNSGCFFKVLSSKRMAKKGKKTKGSRE